MGWRREAEPEAGVRVGVVGEAAAELFAEDAACFVCTNRLSVDIVVFLCYQVRLSRRWWKNLQEARQGRRAIVGRGLPALDAQ